VPATDYSCAKAGNEPEDFQASDGHSGGGVLMMMTMMMMMMMMMMYLH